MPEVGGENPGIQKPRSDVIKPKEVRNGQAIVVQSFLRAAGFMNEFPADRLTPQQLAARDLIAKATTQTIDSKKRQIRNKFGSLDGLKVYDQKEGIPVDDLISFLHARIQSGELDAKDRQTYKKLGKILLQNSSSYYDAHDKGTARRFARIRQEEERVRSDPRLRTGSEYGDYIKAQELLNQRRELIIPPKNKKQTKTTDNINIVPTDNSTSEPTGEALSTTETSIPPKEPGAEPEKTNDLAETQLDENSEPPPPPHETATPPETPVGRKAVWKNNDSDIPVVVTKSLGINESDGQEYFAIEGSNTGIPASQLEFAAEEQVASSPDTETTPDETTKEYEDEESPASTEYSEYADTTPLEDVRRDFYIINRAIDVRKRAAELAEEAVRNEQRRGSGFNPLNWARKVRMRIFEEFYRQRYIDRASRAMIENNNTFLGMDVINNAVTNAKRQIDDERTAGQSKIEGLRTGERTVGENVRQAEGEIKTTLMNDLIRPIVAGEITNYEQVQERLRAFVEAHRADPQIQELFGADANQWGRQADYFATDLLEMGNVVKADIAANKYALDALDSHINIQLANTDWAAETQAQFTAADRAVAWAQSNRLTGLLGNPAFVGAVTSIGIYGTMRALGAGARAADWVPGAGMLTGAAFAGIRRNYDIKVDRASNQITESYSMRAEGAAPRREALNRYNYETASVNILLNGNAERGTVGGDTRGLRELLRLDLSETTNREALLRRTAEIRTRLDFSARESVDLVTFESRETVEQGRLELIRGIVEARLALQSAGMTQEQIAEAQARFAGEWDARFTQNREQQDRAFRNYRLRNVAGAALFGGLAGLGSGLLVKEGLTLARDQLNIDINPVGLIREGTGKIKDFKDLFQKGGSTQVGDYTINAGADHSFSIVDSSGKTIANHGLSVSENGHITAQNASPDVIKQFQDAGFDIKDGGETTRTIFDAAGATEYQSIPGTDGAQHDTLIPKGTIWKEDGGKFDLITQGHPSKILINDASFDANGKFSYDQATSEVVNIKFEGGTKPVFGPDGEWAKHAKAIDHREWYSYDQPNSQGNELGFDTHKNGDSITLDMTRMGLGYQNGLNPNPIDVQQAIANREVGFAFSNPADPQNPIWVSDEDDGTWDGKVTLSPTNANAEIYKMVINQEALSKLSDGNIATELNGHQNVFSIGSEGKMGTIEAGRLVPGQNGTALQTFATIRGSTPTPPTIGGVEIPSISIDKPITETLHITELIPPSEREIPIIPIPFAPRYPLEEIFGPGARDVLPPPYGRYGELTPKDKEFYRNRLSERLRNDPNAILRPEIEIADYLNRQSEEYRQELNNYSSQEGMREQMNNACETVICVPVYALGEGKVVKNALEQYLLQIDKNRNINAVDPNQVEFLIFLNYPKDVKQKLEQELGHDFSQGAEERVKNGKPEKYDTAEVVKQFSQAHPELNIRVMTKEFDERPRWGKIIKPLYDMALDRTTKRSNPFGTNPLIITNDIDATSMSPAYIKRLLEEKQASEANTTARFDGVVGKIDMPNHGYQSYPGFLVAERMFQFLDAQSRRKQGGAITQGRNTGIMASTYAAIGGVNTDSDAGGDTELGKMISAGRGNNNTIHYLNAAWLETDPRRELDEWKKGVPLAYAWDSWGNMNMYGKGWQERFGRTMEDPTKIDKENLEKEIYFEMERWGLNTSSPEIQRALEWIGLKSGDYHIGQKTFQHPRGETITANTFIIDNVDHLAANLKAFVEEERWKKTDRKIESESGNTRIPRPNIATTTVIENPGALASAETTPSASTEPAMTAAPRTSAESSVPIMKESIKASGLKLNPMPVDTGTDNAVDFFGRKIVLVDINGVQVPFYLSTGLGGKANVASGKWYPFFGIGDDGWINKTSEEDMNTYYGNSSLRKVAETLDATVGDIRNTQSMPKISEIDAAISTINAGLLPPESRGDQTGNLQKNIQVLLDKITVAQPSETTPAAPGQVNKLSSARNAIAQSVNNATVAVANAYPNGPARQAAQAVTGFSRRVVGSLRGRFDRSTTQTIGSPAVAISDDLAGPPTAIETTPTDETAPPAANTNQIQTVRGQLTAETVAATVPADALSPNDKWAVDAIEPGGTPNPSALRIENVVDGQECLTPSGKRGKVIDHVTLPDGSQALRIKIISGEVSNIWGTFDQEDLNNGKISTWIANADTPPTS